MAENNHTGYQFDNSYARLPNVFYTRVDPDPVSTPKLLILNDSLVNSLGLKVEELHNKEGIEVLAGNRIPTGAFPIAQAYAGHQYGHFTMLGDGRAVLLGEHVTPSGKRVDIQLKGSGQTPYSRGGDGRAALGPMLREYIISEAMHGLGIATTRSLAVVTTGESVLRETPLPGAILTRVASSHLRVGTFEYIARWGTFDDLKIVADYSLQRHFPKSIDAKYPYLALLQEVCKAQAKLIAKWQMVGFIHGVMNTDNMTISGETIDYGPCAFMDDYDPDTVFSSIDTYGRYAYGNQPKIAGWNLARFAETLLPLLHEDQEVAVKIAQDAIFYFKELYQSHWLSGMRSKLGLFNEEKQDAEFIESLLKMMHKYHADFTNTFVALTFDKIKDTELHGKEEFTSWYEWWQGRLGRQSENKESSHELMRKSNPAVIPRNYQVEAALDGAVKQGDYKRMMDLMNILSCPYAHSPQQAQYATLPPKTNTSYRTFCGT